MCKHDGVVGEGISVVEGVMVGPKLQQYPDVQVSEISVPPESVHSTGAGTH